MQPRWAAHCGLPGIQIATPLGYRLPSAAPSEGLEADHVVLVTLDNDVSDTLLYAGVSRAVTGLTVVRWRRLLASGWGVRAEAPIWVFGSCDLENSKFGPWGSPLLESRLESSDGEVAVDHGQESDA